MSFKPLEEVRWGVIGCGNVCEVKSAPAMNKIPGSKLVAVMRRDEAKIKDYADRHHVPKWYTNAQQLIDDPDINAIYIATPPNLHLHYTQAVAAAGKPVYVEKPMARNYQECLQMNQACEKANIPIFVAYYRRCLPHFLQVKKWIEAGHIGMVRTVQIDLYQSIRPEVLNHVDTVWRVQPEISGGGYFYDLASHQLDLLDYFFGPIVEANGIPKNQAGLYAAEDVVSGSFVFDNGVVGNGMWCFSVANNARKEEAIIRGTKGWIKFHFFTSPTIQIVSETLNQTMTFELPYHIQQPLIETIVQELRGNGTCPSTGATAIRTNWAMDQVLNAWI